MVIIGIEFDNVFLEFLMPLCLFVMDSVLISSHFYL